MIYAIVYLVIGIVIAIAFNLYIIRLRSRLPGAFPEVDWFDFGVVVVAWPYALTVIYLDRKDFMV